MTRWLRSFGAFWYDFVIGDDWRGAAVVAVALALTGIAVRAPLARVPENAMKFAVGIMLTSFGTFWGAEGAGASWPAGDAALLALVPGVALVALGMVRWLRHAASRTAAVRTTA